MAVWDRLRRRRVASSSAPSPAPAPVDAPADPVTSAPRDPGWASVPPLRPALADSPRLLSDGNRFTAQLSTQRDPSFQSGLETRHDGPVGVVRDFLRPAGPARRPAAGSPLPVRTPVPDVTDTPAPDSLLPVPAASRPVTAPRAVTRARSLVSSGPAEAARRLPVRPRPPGVPSVAGAPSTGVVQRWASHPAPVVPAVAGATGAQVAPSDAGQRAMVSPSQLESGAPDAESRLGRLGEGAWPPGSDTSAQGAAPSGSASAGDAAVQRAVLPRGPGSLRDGRQREETSPAVVRSRALGLGEPMEGPPASARFSHQDVDRARRPATSPRPAERRATSPRLPETSAASPRPQDARTPLPRSSDSRAASPLPVEGGGALPRSATRGGASPDLGVPLVQRRVTEAQEATQPRATGRPARSSTTGEVGAPRATDSSAGRSTGGQPVQRAESPRRAGLGAPLPATPSSMSEMPPAVSATAPGELASSARPRVVTPRPVLEAAAGDVRSGEASTGPAQSAAVAGPVQRAVASLGGDTSPGASAPGPETVLRAGSGQGAETIQRAEEARPTQLAPAMEPARSGHSTQPAQSPQSARSSEPAETARPALVQQRAQTTQAGQPAPIARTGQAGQDGRGGRRGSTVQRAEAGERPVVPLRRRPEPEPVGPARPAPEPATAPPATPTPLTAPPSAPTPLTAPPSAPTPLTAPPSAPTPLTAPPSAPAPVNPRRTDAPLPAGPSDSGRSVSSATSAGPHVVQRSVTMPAVTSRAVTEPGVPRATAALGEAGRREARAAGQGSVAAPSVPSGSDGSPLVMSASRATGARPSPAPVNPRPVSSPPRTRSVQRAEAAPATLRTRSVDAGSRPAVAWRPLAQQASTMPGPAIQPTGTVGPAESAGFRSVVPLQQSAAAATRPAPIVPIQNAAAPPRTAPVAQGSLSASAQTVPVVQRTGAAQAQGQPQPASVLRSVAAPQAQAQSQPRPAPVLRPGTVARRAVSDAAAASGDSQRAAAPPRGSQRAATSSGGGQRAGAPAGGGQRTAASAGGGQRAASTQQAPVTIGSLVEQIDDSTLTALLGKFKREHIDALAHRLNDPLQRMVRADMRASRERSARLRDGWR